MNICRPFETIEYQLSTMAKNKSHSVYDKVTNCQNDDKNPSFTGAANFAMALELVLCCKRITFYVYSTQDSVLPKVYDVIVQHFHHKMGFPFTLKDVVRAKICLQHKFAFLYI